MPASLEDTKFVEVYNEEQFLSMISDLRNVCEIAVDLEVRLNYFIIGNLLLFLLLLFLNRLIVIVLTKGLLV